ILVGRKEVGRAAENRQVRVEKERAIAPLGVIEPARYMVAGGRPDHAGDQRDAIGAQQTGKLAGCKLGALFLVVMPTGVIDRVMKPDGGLDALRIGQGVLIAAHEAQHGLDMREVMIMALRRRIGAHKLVPKLAVYQRQGTHGASTYRRSDKGGREARSDFRLGPGRMASAPLPKFVSHLQHSLTRTSEAKGH